MPFLQHSRPLKTKLGGNMPALSDVPVAGSIANCDTHTNSSSCLRTIGEILLDALSLVAKHIRENCELFNSILSRMLCWSLYIHNTYTMGKRLPMINNYKCLQYLPIIIMSYCQCITVCRRREESNWTDQLLAKDVPSCQTVPGLQSLA